MGEILNWGILSTGKISHDFVASLQGKPSHKVVACAARSLENAKKFAGDFKIPKYFDNYEDLVKDSQVQAVYIGSINPCHLALAKMCLANGKPVLCEKPLCMNLKETQELVDFARNKNVFLMEVKIILLKFCKIFVSFLIFFPILGDLEPIFPCISVSSGRIGKRHSW